MERIGVPLFLKPVLVDKVWGGNRLGRLLGKPLPPGRVVGESWEVVDRPEAQSAVDGGPFAGWTLRRLMEERTEALLGPDLAARRPQRFPLLAKYVDAGEALSVQVHPDDAGARSLGYSDRGKCECWVVLHAEPGSRITRGLKPGVTRASFEAALSAGRVAEVLHSFEPRMGDVIAIPPGTIHAIGPGIVIAEIQQNSDLTFRVHDYGRLGLDGKPRPMHVKESLETITFNGIAKEFFGEAVSPATVSTTKVDCNGMDGELLLAGRYFSLGRIHVKPDTCPNPLSGTNILKSGWPTILMCLAGHGLLGTRLVSSGQTFLFPADLDRKPGVTIEAQGTENLTLLVSAPTPDA